MKVKKRRSISLFSLLTIALLVVGIGYAAINSIILEMSGTLNAEVPHTIFIKNVEYVSNIGANTTTSKIENFSGTMMQSSVELSKTNPNSEIIYKVTVYNNSSKTGTFLDVIYDEANYDNKGIVYEIQDNGFKIDDTIAPKESKDIYIKFKYKDSTVAANNVLNSYLNFKIAEPNMLKSVTNSGDFFGAVARDKIEEIKFELGNVSSNSTQTFDASEKGDGSIMGYVTDTDQDNLYEITFSSDSIIFANTNSSNLFYNLTKLTNISFNNFNTRKATDMSHMFRSCSGLISLDLSKFDTSKVTNMSYMFYYCKGLTSLNVSNFDTSKVTNMSYMFSSCNNLTSLDLSNFNTANVTYMSSVFSNCSGLTSLEISNFETPNVTDMSYMFSGCSKLINLDVSNFVTVKVTTMHSMFNACSGLTSLDVSKFDTSQVTDIASMFRGCSGLTSLEVSKFDTSKVTIMYYMFYNCSKLTSLNVSNFNTANVTNMSYMFYNCSKLTSLNVSNFNTANVTNMSNMFYNCSGLTSLNVSNFNTANVTNMSYMFYNCSNLNTIYASDNFNTDKVTSSSGMFSGCTKLKGGNGTTYSSSYIDKTYARIDKSGTKGYFTLYINYLKSTSSESSSSSTFLGMGKRSEITKVIFKNTTADAPTTAVDVSYLGDKGIIGWISDTTAYIASNNTIYANPNSNYLFANLTSLTSIEGLNLLDTTKVTNMSSMFSYCSVLTSLDLSNFNTLNVLDMIDMFSYCRGLTSLDLSNFNTSNATNMKNMFSYCSGLTNLDLSNFDTSKATNMMNMFSYCSSLTNLDLSKFDTANVTNMTCMFISCRSLISLDLSNFNTVNVTRMSSMFDGCGGLTSLDLSNFDTANVTDMGRMFYGCGGLTSLDLNNFDTANVTNMSYMFSACSSLTSLELSNFDTSKVTSMGSIFFACSNLSTIYASDNFNTDKVTSSSSMFSGCTKLKGGNGTAYNSSYIDKTYARIDKSGTPGYFTKLNSVDDIAYVQCSVQKIMNGNTYSKMSMFSYDANSTGIYGVYYYNFANNNAGNNRNLQVGAYFEFKFKFYDKDKNELKNIHNNSGNIKMSVIPVQNTTWKKCSLSYSVLLRENCSKNMPAKFIIAAADESKYVGGVDFRNNVDIGERTEKQFNLPDDFSTVNLYMYTEMYGTTPNDSWYDKLNFNFYINGEKTNSLEQLSYSSTSNTLNVSNVKTVYDSSYSKFETEFKKETGW